MDMHESHSRHSRVLEILPPPIRAILRDDADLSTWPDLLIDTMQKAWGNHQGATCLGDIPAAEILMCQRFLHDTVVQELEQRAAAELLTSVQLLTHKLVDDPWALDHSERCQLMAALRPQQDHWIARLQGLIEPPRLEGWFPAFLLETPPFAALKNGIGDHTCRTALDTAVADELQYFVDRYRSYLLGVEPDQDGAPDPMLAAPDRYWGRVD